MNPEEEDCRVTTGNSERFFSNVNCESSVRSTNKNLGSNESSVIRDYEKSGVSVLRHVLIPRTTKLQA